MTMLNMVSLWFSHFILRSGIADLISPIYRYSRTSTTGMDKSFTSNGDLLTLFSQIFYGKTIESLLFPIYFAVFKKF